MFKTLTLAVSAIALLSIATPASAEDHGHDHAAPAAAEAPAADAHAADSHDDHGAADAHAHDAPAADAAATDEAAPAADAAVAGDIVATASSNPDFSTLVSALKAADLVEALQGAGPFTVFAPSNEAFAALPEGTLEGLLKPENKVKLQEILKYHVVAGKIASAEIEDGESEVDTMFEGKKLKIAKTAEGVTVNGAKVSAVDVPASNGVIHVIDAVALPH
ncbi:MAG TPA: fasciclin domain-containing protein [Alphaproteobacteria bacterium]|nr:fasciclin domain-containing protein [Alphaproteobacteria bacterium]